MKKQKTETTTTQEINVKEIPLAQIALVEELNNENIYPELRDTRSNLPVSTDLIKSINTNGFFGAICVLQIASEKYLVVDGRQRLKACRELSQIKTIRAVVLPQNTPTEKLAVFSTGMNELRQEDEAHIKAEKYVKLCSLTSDSVARATMGLSEMTSKIYSGYTSCPEAVKSLVIQGKITVRAASDWKKAELEDSVKLSALKSAVTAQGNLSYEQVTELLQQLRAVKRSEKKDKSTDLPKLDKSIDLPKLGKPVDLSVPDNYQPTRKHTYNRPTLAQLRKLAKKIEKTPNNGISLEIRILLNWILGDEDVSQTAVSAVWETIKK